MTVLDAESFPFLKNNTLFAAFHAGFSGTHRKITVAKLRLPETEFQSVIIEWTLK